MVGRDDVKIHEVRSAYVKKPTCIYIAHGWIRECRHFDQFSFFQGYDTVREKWQYVVNDIALIFLPRPAQLNSGVQLVCLPHSPAEYRSVIVMGNILWPFYPFKMLFLWVGELDYLHHIIPFCEHCQTNATLLREILLINLTPTRNISRRTPYETG